MRRVLKKGPAAVEAMAVILPNELAALEGSGAHIRNKGIERIVQSYADLFEEPTGLPPSRKGNDHRITITADNKPAFRNPFKLGPGESVELRKQLEALLEKKHIRPSSSSYGAPVLLVRKKDGSLRLCIDYRGLNAITERDRYPLPHIDSILDRVGKAKCFSKMDLHSGFYQLRMEEKDVHKTAFVTHEGAFEWLVMPMGLTNAPASFQRLMNRVLAPHRAYAVVYLDDVLVFSDSEEEHATHLQAVLEALRLNNLRLSAKKCIFATAYVGFLGHELGGGKIGMEKGKIEAISTWEVPHTQKQLQAFLGFVNFYRQHVRNFAQIAAPLTDLQGRGDNKGGNKFTMTAGAIAAFHKLRQAMMSAPVLHAIDPHSPFVVYTDASDVAVGAVLHQVVGGEEVCVAFASRKLHDAETRYPARDKELLGVVSALRQWRHYLLGRKFTLHTDHESLQYLTTMDISGRKGRLARWAEELADYDFDLHYIKGKNNIADALTRAPQMMTSTPAAVAIITEAQVHVAGATLGDLERDAYFGPVVRALRGEETTPAIQLRAQRFELAANGLQLLDQDANGTPHKRCCVAGEAHQLALIREHHDTPSAGHPGSERTFASLWPHFFWPRMSKAIKRYVQQCDSCQTTKGATTSAPLHPIDTPPAPGHTLTLDFLEVPMSNHGNDYILTVVDKFSKLLKVAATKKTVTAEQAAELLLSMVLPTFGRLPVALISDRDPRFTESDLWQALWTKLDVACKMTTAHRPQADGQSERANRQVIEYLRHYCNTAGSDWDSPLALAQLEFALNSKVSSATQTSALELHLGRAPIPPAALGASDQGAGTDTQTPLEEKWARAREAMEEARERMVREQGKGEQRVHFQVGDLALLHSRNYPQHRQHKLSAPFLGPFKVKRVLSDLTVELDLPDRLRGIHPVINVDQLKRYLQPTPTAPTPATPPNTASPTPPRTITQLVDERVFRGRRQFLARWASEPSSNDTCHGYAVSMYLLSA